jgi:hypothetical protein
MEVTAASIATASLRKAVGMAGVAVAVAVATAVVPATVVAVVPEDGVAVAVAVAVAAAVEVAVVPAVVVVVAPVPVLKDGHTLEVVSSRAPHTPTEAPASAPKEMVQVMVVGMQKPAPPEEEMPVALQEHTLLVIVHVWNAEDEHHPQPLAVPQAEEVVLLMQDAYSRSCVVVHSAARAAGARAAERARTEKSFIVARLSNFFERVEKDGPNIFINLKKKNLKRERK